jgi:hypothetical protein
MLHVASMSRTAAFYALLGFEVANTHHEPGSDDEPVWAWLQSQHGASLMLAEAEEPVDPAAQTILFCLYCDGVGRSGRLRICMITHTRNLDVSCREVHTESGPVDEECQLRRHLGERS